METCSAWKRFLQHVYLSLHQHCCFTSCFFKSPTFFLVQCEGPVQVSHDNQLLTSFCQASSLAFVSSSIVVDLISSSLVDASESAVVDTLVTAAAADWWSLGLTNWADELEALHVSALSIWVGVIRWDHVLSWNFSETPNPLWILANWAALAFLPREFPRASPHDVGALNFSAGSWETGRIWSSG